MLKKLTLFLTGISLTATSLSAQATREEMLATPEKCGGVYYAYPVTDASQVTVTPAPEGYEPFYISHYGRHGSRYLINDSDYSWLLNELQKAADAGALTDLGLDALNRLKLVWAEAEGRGGELSNLGKKQHRGIASRMFDNYPQVFTDDAEIMATSTGVIRCAHSMYSFTEALMDKNRNLKIPRESGKRHMDYLCPWTQASSDFNGQDGTWRPDYTKFKNDMTHPDRLINALFSDKQYVREHIVPDEFMWKVYWFAIGQQNIDTNMSFTDILLPEEMYDMWQVFNMNFYMRNASYPRSNGLHVDNAKPLLRHITENADRYIKEGKKGATLRFGHDGNITPLTALMQLDNCYGQENEPSKIKDVWNDFFVSPMASNVQLIFFKNKSGDVIVKILHNERETHIPVATDMFPYYKWSDVRDYFNKMITTPYSKFMTSK